MMGQDPTREQRRELSPAQIRQRRVAAMRHGLRSEYEHARSLWAKRVRRRVYKLRQAWPGLTPADDSLLRALAEVLDARDRAAFDLSDCGVVGQDGDARRMVGDFD